MALMLNHMLEVVPLLLSLLFNEYVSDIHINDKDISIYAFWYSVLNSTDALCQLIKDTPINVETWFKQKRVSAE